MKGTLLLLALLWGCVTPTTPTTPPSGTEGLVGGLNSTGGIVVSPPVAAPTLKDCEVITVTKRRLKGVEGLVATILIEVEVQVPYEKLYAQVWVDGVVQRFALVEGRNLLQVKFPAPGTYTVKVWIEIVTPEGVTHQCDGSLTITIPPIPPPPPPPPPPEPCTPTECPCGWRWDPERCKCSIKVYTCEPGYTWNQDECGCERTQVECVIPPEQEFTLPHPPGPPSAECALFDMVPCPMIALTGENGENHECLWDIAIIKGGLCYAVVHPGGNLQTQPCGHDISHITFCRCPND